MYQDKIIPTVMFTILTLGGALPVFRWDWHRKWLLWQSRNVRSFHWLNPWLSPEAIDSPFYICFGLFGFWGVWSGQM